MTTFDLNRYLDISEVTTEYMDGYELNMKYYTQDCNQNENQHKNPLYL